ncbi:HET-domain-containing protein, partial [Neurospora tetrasperma FGSC 2509]
MKRKYADFLGCSTSTTSPAAGHKPNANPSGSAASTTRLCVKCLNYNFSPKKLDPDQLPPLGERGYEKPAVFDTYDKLLVSSATCPLHKLVLEGLERTLARGTQQSLSKYGVGKNSKVFAFMLTMQSEGEATIGFFIIPPEEERLRHRILQAPRIAESYLRVYADKSLAHGTASSGRWARNPPLTPWSEPWLDWLKGWLNACLGKHGPECCTTLSGERIDELLPPVLPTRIIDVGPREGSGSARLVESQGERGHYTALSYCWGSSRKSDRPYLTTTETLEKHLSELPWDLLPKTLRDAILLTRAVGMRYLWIDSLCIIQDSNDDWEKEAARMGTLYAQARLVIAATIGTDAQAGLFPFQTYIHHPSRRSIPSWRRSPSLYFRNLPNERGSPQLNLPLFTRGWATQEWVLARRIVFWTQERMCWYCANECVGDDGNSVSTYSGLFQRYTTWKEIATLYSGRDLTYPTDKLIALSGIANEIQKQRPKDK